MQTLKLGLLAIMLIVMSTMVQAEDKRLKRGYKMPDDLSMESTVKLEWAPVPGPGPMPCLTIRCPENFLPRPKTNRLKHTSVNIKQIGYTVNHKLTHK